MEHFKVVATARKCANKGDNGRLRKEGKVPAVIYGGADQPLSVMVDNHEMELILRGAYGSNSVFDLELDGNTQTTLIRDIQRHPLKSTLVHLDFMRVDASQEVDMVVPVHAAGKDPVGVKEGGVLEHGAREVTVRCKPDSLPKFLEANLESLAIGKSFHVSDLQLPAGVVVLDEPEVVLFHVVGARAEAAETEGEVNEPELIGRKSEPSAE